MTTSELIIYYANLLIMRYIGKPRAYATVKMMVTPVVMPQVSTQDINFSPPPTAGVFTLYYDSNQTSVIQWNDTALTIQNYLQALPGLSLVTVKGSISLGRLTVTFTGVTAPAIVLTLGTNSLVNGVKSVVPVILETDVTLPLAVQSAYNVTGLNPAVGVQLDVLGKYAGVARTGQGFTTQITLDDADFSSLIKIATVENSSGSSTYEIVKLLNQFFPDQIFLFDRQTMEFDYYISKSVGSQDLIQIFIVERLLPKPMGVRLRLIIYAPIINRFFGFRTYQAAGYNSTPFNTYTTYHLDYPWLKYSDAIIV